MNLPLPPAVEIRSLWLEGAPPPTTGRAPSSDASSAAGHVFDVLVVGAGLAGLCTALRLAESGARVAVLEAGAVARRTTGHTTAKVTSLHGTIYARLAAAHGPDAAAQYASANQQGVADLRRTVAELAIDCDWTPATAFTCAEHADGLRQIEQEHAAALAAGLDVELTSITDLPFPVAGAVALPDQAHFHPYRFCMGVVDRLRQLGALVVEDTPVTSVDEEDKICRVTAGGRPWTASFVVLATHLPIDDPALLAARARPERSYVVAGPIDPVPSGMYLAADAGWSVRPWLGGDAAMVLVGGQGHAMVEEIGDRSRYDELEAWATERVGLTHVTHRWSAFDYVPVDGVPFIGRLSPHRTRTLVATGFAKWGMTTSMVAARLLEALVQGLQPEHLGLFDASRVRRNLGRELLSTNAKVARRFVGDRLGGKGSTGAPAPGHGEVRTVGGQKAAVATDAQGVVHAVRATCTHLGCLVRFNSAEQTWDCPCHGSRFTIDGSVLDGPAIEPLARVVLPDPSG
jgi:glycine/D-amino acid oxidase-like deaminating enzyme/nitrite reductase/ring-hydroxylating ferredoxin subunit